MDVTKTILHMDCFNRCTDEQTTSFVKVVYIMSLQKITELLHMQWAILLTLDVGSKQDTSYLDFQVWFKYQSKLHNLHFFPISLFNCDTIKVILTRVQNFWISLHQNGRHN